MARSTGSDATVSAAAGGVYAKTLENQRQHGPEPDRTPRGPTHGDGRKRADGGSEGEMGARPGGFSVASDPSELRANICETWVPCEAGGVAMIKFAQAMRADAEAQEQLVPVLGRVLDATVQANSGASATGACALPHFESATPCPLLPSAYIARMLRYTAISPCNLLVGVIYLQRLKDQCDGDVQLTAHNCQRLLLCANMLASKVFDDKYVSNKQWAAVGDLTTKELNCLELEFLVALKFDLNIDRDDYNVSCRMLYRALASMRLEPEAPQLEGRLSAMPMGGHSFVPSEASQSRDSGKVSHGSAGADAPTSPTSGPVPTGSTPGPTPTGSPPKVSYGVLAAASSSTPGRTRRADCKAEHGYVVTARGADAAAHAAAIPSRPAAWTDPRSTKVVEAAEDFLLCGYTTAAVNI